MNNEDYQLIIGSYYKSIEYIDLSSDMKSMPWTKTWKSDLRESLSAHDLENFRLYRFLSGGRDGERGLDKGSLHDTNAFLKYIDAKINKIGRDFVFGLIDGTNVGNCHNSIRYGELITDYGELNAIAWYKTLKPFMPFGIKSACEIGGGFGAFAKVIIKDNENIKYVMLELPDGLLMASYFLKENFKNLNVMLYEQLSGNRLTLEDYKKNDVFVLPPCVEFDEDIKFDFMCNTRSMMEMRKATVSKFFDFIQNVITDKGIFLNINRYSKLTELSEYDYDDNWEVLYSRPAWDQEHIRTLITQRKFKDIHISISDELRHIEELAKLPLKKRNEDLTEQRRQVPE